MPLYILISLFSSFISYKAIKYFLINDKEVPFAIKLIHLLLKIEKKFSGVGSGILNRNHLLSFLDNKLLKKSHLKANEELLEFEIPSLIDDYKIKNKIIYNKNFINFNSNKNKKPTIIYIKGGGFVLDGYESYLFRHFTDKGFIFMIVYYRLAPEKKFPTQIEDCFSALDYIAHLNQNEENNLINFIDKNNLILLGDSAGGNLIGSLAILANLRNLRKKIKIKKQVFIFPTFFYLNTSESYEKYKDWYLLDTKEMKWFAKQYLSNIEIDKKNKLLSPLLYEDEILRNLPSCYFILSERDPLFSEGMYYKDKLLSLGVDVTFRKYPAEHGFIFLERGVKEARIAIRELKEYLCNAFEKELLMDLDDDNKKGIKKKIRGEAKRLLN